jgi:hypothetical protein
VDTYIGMTYEQWSKEQGAKSEQQKQSEAEAYVRIAREGLTNQESNHVRGRVDHNDRRL